MLLSANKNAVDGMSKFMFGQLECPATIVEVTLAKDYQFNTDLLGLKAGQYVLVDYCEYGAKEWDRTKTHIFGRNSQEFTPKFDHEEWQKFDLWVKENPPLLIFKRELLAQDANDYIIPIEYPSLVSQIPPLQTKEEYDARRIELFHYWGWSHESRRTFHGNAWLHAAKNNIALCDNLNHLNGIINGPDSQRVWVTTNIPDFARFPLPTIMQINANSKLSLSLPGCGVKCVRHAESPVNSVMIMQEDNLAWSYPWINNVNSIKADIGMDPLALWGINGMCPEIPAIEEALSSHDLYDIYVAGVENAKRYQSATYVNDHVKANILARL